MSPQGAGTRLTITLVTHNSFTLAQNNLCQTQLLPHLHTQLCHTQLFTHILFTHILLHTTLSHTTLSHTTPHATSSHTRQELDH